MSIIKHVTLQKIVAHDFRYVLRILQYWPICARNRTLYFSFNLYNLHTCTADKTKYMIMSRDQNAGRNYSMKNDNSFIERVEEFKYLGTTLTNKNSIQEEIKSRWKLGNACYYSVQNILSSSLLSKNVKIKIYRTIILPVVLYGCETWSLTLRGGT